MVLQLGAPTGSPMTSTITAITITGAAVCGGFGLFSLSSLWAINRSAREKNKGTISMMHGSEGAPLFGGKIGAWSLMLLYLFSYVIDGTAMTLFGHEPPTFVAAGDSADLVHTLVFSYEFLYLAFWISSLVVPLVINAYRHGLTPGFTAGLATVGVLNCIVGTFLHFQMKSDAFYGLSYTAVIIVGLGLYAVVLSYSNITTIDSYTRAGSITLFSIVGYIGFIVLEMLFCFWFNFWTQQSSIGLEFAWSMLVWMGITIAAQASQYSKLEEMLSHGKSIVQSLGNGPAGMI